MTRLIIATVIMIVQAALLGRALWSLCKGDDGLGWFIASALCGLPVTIALHA